MFVRLLQSFSNRQMNEQFLVPFEANIISEILVLRLLVKLSNSFRSTFYKNFKNGICFACIKRSKQRRTDL